MNLTNLSKITLDSLQECIDRKIKPDDIEIYMVIDDGFAVPINSAHLRFSNVIKGQGILILDNQE